MNYNLGRGLYDDRHEIPIPSEAHINHYDARVFLISPVDKKRIVIGKATSEELMFPNRSFKKLYPDTFEKEYSEYDDPVNYEMKVGMYALCLGASKSNGLYDVLVRAYDPNPANGIMDFSMYSILTRKNVAQLFYERMREEIVFSDAVNNDTWWSDFFKKTLTKDKHFKFRIEWLKHCKEIGINEVWLCIDGSNNDCQMKKSRYAEPGENKSHTKKTIIGYIWAVSAKDGLPITYFVNPGGEVDSQAIQELINFLEGYHFEVSGVILDRGFPTLEVLDLLDGLNIPYVIMLPECYGHKLMVAEHGETIFWNPEYLIDGKELYGISSKVKIWKKYEKTGFINLYYSSKTGHYHGSDFNAAVSAAKKKAEEACKKGTYPVIEKQFKNILSVEKNKDGTFYVNCNFQEWRSQLHGEGFFSILSSEDFGAQKTYDIYSLRTLSEVKFSMSKSQEGYNTTRTHTDDGTLSKLAIAFITTILRHTIQVACKANELDTNLMIQMTDRVKLLINDSGRMIMIRDIPKNLRVLYAYFGLEYENFDVMTEELNHRYSDKVHRPIRVFPTVIKPEPKKRGRKLGSKNKKTIEREQATSQHKEDQDEKESIQKPKLGRRPGSKDAKPRKKRSDAGKKRGPYKKRQKT